MVGHILSDGGETRWGPVGEVQLRMLQKVFADSCLLLRMLEGRKYECSGGQLGVDCVSEVFDCGYAKFGAKVR